MLRLYFWSSLICLLLIHFFLLVSTHMSLSVITPVTVITCAFSTIYQAIFISTHMSLYIHPVNHGPGHKAKWSSLNDQASVRSPAVSSLLFESWSQSRLWVRLDFGCSGCLLLQSSWDTWPMNCVQCDSAPTGGDKPTAQLSWDVNGM